MKPTSFKPRAILFDWDNTLVDTWDCIREAINATLTHMGHAEWTLEETKARVAASLRDSFPRLFGNRWTEARRHFYASFEAIHIARLKALPEAEEMLIDLRRQGIYLAVVSNKKGEFLRREANHLGWTGHFGRLVGATDAAADKPSPAPVLLALADSGIAPGPDVWFVGDAAIDIECAVNSGCHPVLMRDTGPAMDEFGLCQPARHVSGCREFAALVHELLVPISGI